MNEVSFATQKLCNFIKVHLLIVGLISRVTRALLRRSLSEPIPYSFFQDCQSFRSNIEIFFDLFGVDLCAGWERKIKFYSLTCRYPVSPTKGKRCCVFSNVCFCYLCKLVSVGTRTYIWVLDSIPLSVFIPIPCCCTYYYGFIVKF